MISLWIDQVNVQPTNIISFVNDVTLTVKSNKGKTSWNLYFNDQKLESGNDAIINLKRLEGTYILDVEVIDSYGFKENKRFIFHYPKKKTESIVNKEETLTLENIKINQTNQREETLTPSEVEVELKEDGHYLQIGGGFIAIGCFGWFIYGRKRNTDRK